MLTRFIIRVGEYLAVRNRDVDAAACGVTRNQKCVKVFKMVWDIPLYRQSLDLRNVITGDRPEHTEHTDYAASTKGPRIRVAAKNRPKASTSHPEEVVEDNEAS